MLIIAIGHSNQFSCSCTAKAKEVKADNMESVRSYICKAQNLSEPSLIEELLVVKNDAVVSSWGPDELYIENE